MLHRLFWVKLVCCLTMLAGCGDRSGLRTTLGDPTLSGGAASGGSLSSAGGSSAGGSSAGGSSAGGSSAGGAFSSGGRMGAGGHSSGGTHPSTGGSVADTRPWTDGIPPLFVRGNEFVDPEGNRVILRGVAFADLRQLNEERGMMNVERLLSTVDNPDEEFYARVVRYTVLPEVFLQDPQEYFIDHLLPAVQLAAHHGLYAIVDWHEISDLEPAAERTQKFWERAAPLFASYTNVLFELFNEPMESDDPDWYRWKSYAQPWVSQIRAVAPHNIILIGGPFWSQRIEGAVDAPFEGTNLAYVGHVYSIVEPHVWSEQGPLSQVSAVYPVMVTEWGFRNDGNEIWDGTIRSFGAPLQAFIERHALSWTAWCADSLYGPNMFDEDWNLLEGNAEMGGFVRDWLRDRKDDDQPARPF